MSGAEHPPARLLDAPTTDEARADAARALIAATQALGASAASGRIDADAVMLRALLSGAAPQDAALLKSVWGRVQARHGAPLSVWGGLAFTLAADRFGLGARSTTEPEQALAAVEEGARAILDIGGGRPWWGRLLARPELRIVMALPDDARSLPRALMVSKEPSGPSGDDRTFWTTDSTAPDARIIAALSDAGLAASPLTAAGGLRLFMLMGYVQPDDPRLADAPGSLTGVLGSAPVF